MTLPSNQEALDTRASLHICSTPQCPAQEWDKLATQRTSTGIEILLRLGLQATLSFLQMEATFKPGFYKAKALASALTNTYVAPV